MSDVQIFLTTSWTYHNWRFEDYRECQAGSKGLKYREPNRINWKATKNMIFESTDLYAEHRQKRNKIISNISLNRKKNLKNLLQTEFQVEREV